MSYQLLTPSAGDLARLVGVQFVESSTQHLQACLAFKIDDPNSANNGRVTTYFGSFHPNAVEFTVGALRACGWSGDDVATIPAAFDRGELAEVVSLKIINEPVLDRASQPVLDGNGAEKWRDRIAFVNVPGGGGGVFKAERPVEGAELAKFGARLRTLVGSVGGKKKPAAKPQGAAPPRSSGRGGGASPASHAHDDNIPPPSDADHWG